MRLRGITAELQPGSFGLRVLESEVTVPEKLMVIFTTNSLTVPGQVMDFLVRHEAHISRILGWDKASYQRALDEAQSQLAPFPHEPVYPRNPGLLGQREYERRHG